MKRRTVDEIISNPHLVVSSTLFGCSAYSLTYIETFSDGQVGGERICYLCSIEIEKELFKDLIGGKFPDYRSDVGRIWDFSAVKEIVRKLKEDKYDIQEINFY